VTTTSPEGLVTTSTYDPDNRLTAVAYSDGVTPGITYVYDPAGLLTSMTDGTGTTSYTSNADGQPTTVTNGAGQSVSYAYNADGNPTTITYPNGKKVTDTYNADQLLTAVTDWSSDKTSFGYNKDGVLTSETYPSGDTAAYTVSKDSELTAATTTGRAISAPAQTYTYNPLSQLTGTGTASYGYDNAADPTTLGSTTQAFNPGGQLASATTSGTTTSYGYNADGDRTSAITSGATNSYGYDEADQLTSYTPATGPATTYEYNGDGLLMSQTTSGTTTSFTWDTNGSVPVMLTAGATSYIYGPGGLPVESVPSSGTPTYYMQDQLGSTRLLTSSTGAVTGTYTYDPWGNITSHTGTATTPFLYAGQYQDPETGFYYLRNRWYDPVTAQFLTIDPAVSQTQTPYIYTSDNPLNATDLLGLCWPTWACGVEHAVGSAAGSVLHFVAQHKVAIGIGLGILAVATGFGALLIAGGAIEVGLGTEIAVSAVSFASGTTAAVLDGRDCYENPGINGPCTATVLGGIGALMSVPEALVGAGLIDEPPFQELLGLTVGGFFLSYAALATDAIDAAYRAWRDKITTKAAGESCAQT
jgi:RHS repeat-associated protein